jgi:hypothetical protein
VGFVRHSKRKCSTSTPNSSRPDAGLLQEADSTCRYNIRQDISNELHNKTAVVLPEPVQAAAVLTRHAVANDSYRTSEFATGTPGAKHHPPAAVAKGNYPEALLKLA